MPALDHILIIFIIQAKLRLVSDFDEIFWSGEVKARLKLYILLCCLRVDAIFFEDVGLPGALFLRGF